jgi:hypothetical protein
MKQIGKVSTHKSQHELAWHTSIKNNNKSSELWLHSSVCYRNSQLLRKPKKSTAKILFEIIWKIHKD